MFEFNRKGVTLIIKEENKLILSYDDVSLLRKSYIVNKFPSLQKLISTQNNIHYSDLQHLEEDTSNILKYDSKSFKETLYSEWEAVKNGNNLYKDDLEIGYEHCEVCNAADNRYLYYIRNKLNENEMHVGSSCILKYIDIGLNGEQKLEYIKKQDNIYKKMQNIAQFNKLFPNAKLIVNSWLEFYNSLKLKIPSDLEKKFQNCYRKAHSIIKKVEDESLSKTLIENFQNLILLNEEIKKKINNYINKNKDNPFTLTVKISNWLINKKEFELHKKLCKNCLIGENDFKYIYENDFILQFIPEFSKALKTLGIYNIECDFDANNFILSYKKNKLDIKLNCSIKDFLRKFYLIIFNKKADLNLKNLISICNVNRGITNIEYAISEIESELNKNYIYVDFYDIQYNILFIKYQSKYKRLPLDGILNNTFKVFLIQKEEINSIIYHMKTSDNWIEYEDYRELMKNYLDRESHKEFFDNKEKKVV